MAEPQIDPVADILRRAPALDATRAEAWDAFHAAATPEEFAAKVKDLKLPDSVKADLWDLKQQQAPSGAGAMNFAVVNGQRVPVEDDNSVGTFARHLVDQINPIEAIATIDRAVVPEAVARAAGSTRPEAYGPLNAVKAVGAAQGSLFDKAKASYEKGDYFTAGRHFLDYLIPILGPALDKSADEMQEGKFAAGVADAIGLGLNVFGPEGLAKVLDAVKAKLGTRALPPLKPNPNPVEAAAAQWGEQAGIPIDVATATGSPGLGKLQEKASANWAGAGIAEPFRRRQVEAFQRVGNDLADRVNATTPGQAGVPVSRLDAGGHVTHAFEHEIGNLGQQADAAYNQFRALEAQRPMPVDLRPIRSPQSPLRQLFNRLEEENDAVKFLDGTAKARAYRALKRLMAAPDQAPASIVDSVLSDLKELARGADLPELRNEAQGAAALSVRELETQLRDAVARQGGPQAMALLDRARTATRTKWGLADIRDRFIGNGEPGGIFDRLVRDKDRSIVLLRDIEAAVPGQMPHIGRAVLEEMIDKATEKGAFDHTDALFKDWQALGPETKRTLFGPHVSDLDQFFQLARMVGKRFNTSSTALSLEADKFLKALKTYPLAKLAYSPGAVRALTQGLRLSFLVPGSGSRAMQVARAAAMANLARAAQRAGVTVDQEQPPSR